MIRNRSDDYRAGYANGISGEPRNCPWRGFDEYGQKRREQWLAGYRAGRAVWRRRHPKPDPRQLRIDAMDKATEHAAG